MTLTGYNRQPQGSVLTQFLYNLLEFGMDKFAPSGCNFLQYADDIMVYSSHHVLQTAYALDGLLVTQRFFFAAWPHNIPCKVGDGIGTIRIGGSLLPQSVSFKYLGVFLRLDLDGELKLDMFRKGVYKDKFFEIDR
jgi:hypothetical protein